LYYCLALYAISSIYNRCSCVKYTERKSQVEETVTLSFIRQLADEGDSASLPDQCIGHFAPLPFIRQLANSGTSSLRSGTLHPFLRSGTLHPFLRSGTLHPSLRSGTLSRGYPARDFVIAFPDKTVGDPVTIHDSRLPLPFSSFGHFVTTLGYFVTVHGSRSTIHGLDI
jgi:hypothetical protein